MDLIQAWVQRHFLGPEWLIAAPFLIALLVILYFLKLKRREVAVSSTYLWKKALEDLRVNSPFQRLRMNLLLFLQVFILAAMLAALARPIANLRGLGGRQHVVLVDRSASMNATDGEGNQTRLQFAVEQARRIVDGLSLGDECCLIAFDEQAEVLSPLTDQKALLREALAKIKPTDRRTRLALALDVARGILAQLKAPVLTIISDGKVGDLRDAAVPKDAEVHFVRAGSSAENVGLASIEVRRAFEGGEASRVFGTVVNASGAKRTVAVDCFLDKDLVASKEVEVAAGEQSSVVFESAKLRAGLLRLSIDGTDVLPTDDLAYAVLKEKRDVRVLIVTEGNPFLEKGFQQDPLVRKDAAGAVPKLSPQDFSPEDPGLKVFDLVVLDRVEPKTLQPGNYLFIDALPPFEGLRTKGTAQRPSVVDWDDAHPIARFVSFGALDPASARKVGLRKEDKVIVSSTPGGDAPRRRAGAPKPGAPPEEDTTIPLVFEARDGERHALVLAFDVLRTQSWPLRAGFPIFLANVVRWLGGSGREERALGVRTGEVAEIPVPKGSTKATVTDPQKVEHPVTLKLEDDVLRWADTGSAGFYQVRFEGGDAALEKSSTTWFAANLASPEESDAGPLGPEDRLELVNLDAPVKAEEKVEDAKKELWKAFALAAFVVLLLEWWIYNRRVYV